MAKQLKKGDKVEWNTSQGKTKGTVKKKLTSPTKIKGHDVEASKSNPEYLVESSKTGAKAAHKPGALRKVSGTKTAGKGKASSNTSDGGAAKSSSRGSASKTASAKKTASGGSGKAASGSGKSASSSKAKSAGAAKSKSSSSGAAKKSAPSGKKAAAKPSAQKSAKRSTASGKSPAKASSGGRASSAKKTASSSTPPKRTSSGKAAKSSPAKRSGSKGVNGKSNGDETVIAEFKKMMNMPAKELDRWLETAESKRVGFKERGKGESIGHESGRRILDILGKRKDRYTEADVGHIHKVVGYVKRHLAQKPKGDITASNWRYSLMNWGHDPAK